MRRLGWCIMGLAICALGSPATAKDELDRRVSGILKCSGLTDPTARLGCYDEAMAVLKSAVDDGEIEFSERQRPRSMEGVVKASGMVSDTNFWVELDNGDRWRLRPTSWRNKAPGVGTPMKISRGLGGNYWISGPGWRSSDAEFEGHKD